jgi:uncharacterized membrane protein YjgN (DUF898 family)
MKNFFLNLITLGIYRAWAKTNMRKYTFSSFMIDDTRLEYSGRGGELFKGFAIVALFYFVLTFAVDFAFEVFHPEESKEIEAMSNPSKNSKLDTYSKYAELNEELEFNASPELKSLMDESIGFDINHCLQIYDAEKCDSLYGEYLDYDKKQLAIKSMVSADSEQLKSDIDLGANVIILMVGKGLFFGILFLLFLYFATFSAFRYRLTRTRYKGIHGAVRNVRGLGYMWVRIKRCFLNIISFGYLIGRGDLVSQKYILQNSYIGKTKFNFDPDIKSLDNVNLITGLLAIPTLFISRQWYKAALLNTKYKNLSINNICFESNFTGGALFWLRFSNLLIILLSFGLLSAIVLQRSLKFLSAKVSIRGGANDLQFIQQEADLGTVGEGLDEAADFGGFDIDFGMI